MRDTREEVDADEVMLNTVLAVKAGEAIPIDGENCEVDEKTLTGESFPVAKQEDSIVTTALAEDCVVAKMAKLVEEARNSKSKTQRFIDKFAQYYTPAVIFMPAGVAVIPLALRVHNRDHWFYLALGKIKAMAFDKTGTITRGEFVVTDFHHLCEDLEELQNFPGEGIQGKNEVKNICIDNRKIAHRASGTDQIPYIESGTYVAYNDENGGVIQCLKEDIWPSSLDAYFLGHVFFTLQAFPNFYYFHVFLSLGSKPKKQPKSNDFSEVEVDDDEDEDEGFSYD
uniref:P-type ATPase A domain-containing protein n=1 Tax=Populus alba TaxID=43335 RepID=A0A4U5NRA1_POPAL|nr:hypothetical protein D5086_0000249170 [Populus alba]